MLAEVLDVADLEPGVFHEQHRVADVEKFAVGKHVSVHEAPAGDHAFRQLTKSRG